MNDLIVSDTPASTGQEFRRGPRGHLLLPGGIGRSTLYVGTGTPHAVRGEGYRLWDDQGRELLDANNNFTVSIHGHGHPEIVRAAKDAIDTGACYGLPNWLEWDHAQILLDRFPALDQVRYANSGTEAVMGAIRLARASTGRDGVLVMQDGYHGTSDVALCAGGDHYRRGVTEGVQKDVVTVPVNDLQSLRSTVEGAPDRFAAILIDLLPNRAGLLSIETEFLQLARDLATRHGIVLIIDEVISLRLGYGGLIGEYGIEPDLVTVGKIIGGGFPVGAIIGRESVMRELDVTSATFLEHSGTFTANPVCMAAGAVSLQLLTAAEIARLNALGDLARASIQSRIADAGWEVRGRGSLFRPFPIGKTQVANDVRRALWWAAYERGLLLSQATGVALSTPMNDEVVQDISDRLVDALLSVAAVTES